MNAVGKYIISQNKGLYKDMSIEGFIRNIPQAETDTILKEMLRGLMVDSLESDYYFNRFCNLESLVNVRQPRYALCENKDYSILSDSYCMWKPVKVERNKEMDMKFQTIERRILK